MLHVMLHISRMLPINGEQKNDNTEYFRCFKRKGKHLNKFISIPDHNVYLEKRIMLHVSIYYLFTFL